MTTPEDEVCPLCDASLQGAKIPEKDRHFYGDKKFYSRKIGVEISGVYDGVLYWVCPDCHKAWQRWPEGSSRAQRAAPHIERNNARGLP